MDPSFRPPIVEAVIDLNCDLPPDFTVAGAKERARELLRERFSRFHEKLHLHAEIKDQEGGPSVTKAERSVEALLFHSADGKEICQIRDKGYSFNRLAPYTRFEDYQDELFRTWRVYREIVQPVVVRQVMMRYINRIEIPTDGQEVEMEEYFTMVPSLPDAMGLTQHQCFLRHVASDPDTGCEAAVVFAIEKPSSSGFPVLLDIHVGSTDDLDPENEERLVEIFEQLRGLKNRIFENTLTNKCRQLLSQTLS